MSTSRPIETYRKMLPVMKHRLDDELEIQAQIYDDISRQVAIENSRMLSNKDLLARTEAELLQQFKDDAEGKATKDYLESKVTCDPARRKAFTSYQDARASHEEWAGLLEAWRQKGYSIKTLADLYSASYFALDTSTRNRHESLRGGQDRVTSDTRAEMRRSFAGARAPITTAEQSDQAPRRRTQVNG